jgi:hypothetical protein
MLSHHQALRNAIAGGLQIGHEAGGAIIALEHGNNEAILEAAAGTPRQTYVQLRNEAYVLYMADMKGWQAHLDVTGEFIPLPGRYLSVEAAVDAVRKAAVQAGFTVTSEREGRLSRTLELAPCGSA